MKYKIKKLIIPLLLIISLIGAFMLGACSTTTTSAESTPKELVSDFDLEFLDTLGGFTNVYLLTDNEYHKNYIIIHNDNTGSVAITPRLEK